LLNKKKGFSNFGCFSSELNTNENEWQCEMNVFNEKGLSLDQCMSAKEIVLQGICINLPSHKDICTENSFISGTMAQ
jgi:hypothetical protein